MFRIDPETSAGISAHMKLFLFCCRQC
jgi:hypothetical protein